MRQSLAPLEREPVSVHAPFVSYPGGQYRHEPAEERRTALLAALDGVQLGAYDERIVQWLAGWDVPVVAAIVSLLRRARHTAAQQAHRGGGEPR
ncbi:MAG: hypothetical protein JO063_07800 [Pseudonocardiales bacterium]|nr:hypothetical protein [Pseudonocardiales bacterium]MBV9028700.1 hypothetical protein [Pseudonocardiales bacterium]MBW0010005.1 hypothetical protein [Pseudonocardiales bacterium]